MSVSRCVRICATAARGRKGVVSTNPLSSITPHPSPLPTPLLADAGAELAFLGLLRSVARRPGGKEGAAAHLRICAAAFAKDATQRLVDSLHTPRWQEA